MTSTVEPVLEGFLSRLLQQGPTCKYDVLIETQCTMLQQERDVGSCVAQLKSSCKFRNQKELQPLDDKLLARVVLPPCGADPYLVIRRD